MRTPSTEDVRASRLILEQVSPAPLRTAAQRQGTPWARIREGHLTRCMPAVGYWSLRAGCRWETGAEALTAAVLGCRSRRCESGCCGATTGVSHLARARQGQPPPASVPTPSAPVCIAGSALLWSAGTLPRPSGSHMSHSAVLAAAIGRAQLATVFQDTPERRAATQKRMADMLAMFEFEVSTAARGWGQPGQARAGVAVRSHTSRCTCITPSRT